MNKKLNNKSAFTLIELLVVITIIGILAALALPVFQNVQERGYVIQAVSNAKQIGLALSVYAMDEDGDYPDSVNSSVASSNDAFRELVLAGILENEEIFGANRAKNGKPDGDISTEDLILEAGENHWEMTAGLASSSKSSMPLIWEDSIDATWNPTWDANLEQDAEGRAWSNGSVIVLLNDQSAEARKLNDRRGGASQLAADGALNLFEAAIADSDGQAGTAREVLDNEDGA